MRGLYYHLSASPLCLRMLNCTYLKLSIIIVNVLLHFKYVAIKLILSYLLAKITTTKECRFEHNSQTPCVWDPNILFSNSFIADFRHHNPTYTFRQQNNRRNIDIKCLITHQNSIFLPRLFAVCMCDTCLSI